MTSSTMSLRPRARKQRGATQVFVLILIIPLAAVAAAAMSMGNRQMAEQDATRMRDRALLRAESGVQHAVAQLMENKKNLETIEVTEEGKNALLYRVEIENLGDDVERLLPKRISGEEQRARLSVVKRQGEHAVQLGQTSLALADQQGEQRRSIPR